MTERSRPWDGSSTGDASEAPYDAPTEFARILRALIPGVEINTVKGGIINTAAGFSAYGISAPGGGVARIASGLGWNQGTWHESDANVDIAIPTPASATRIDRIVLRKSWASQTVRLTRIAGAEGGAAPAVTQTFGTTWDVTLWQVQITTGGAITFPVDERPFLKVPPHTHNAGASASQTYEHDGGQISHASLGSIGVNAHSAIDTHLAANAVTGTGSGVHGMQRFDTTGSQSMGTPTDGKMTFARANGGTLTITTPSGSIFVGNTNSGGSFAITSGDSYTLIADGTNWKVF